MKIDGLRRERVVVYQDWPRAKWVVLRDVPGTVKALASPWFPLVAAREAKITDAHTSRPDEIMFEGVAHVEHSSRVKRLPALVKQPYQGILSVTCFPPRASSARSASTLE